MAPSSQYRQNGCDAIPTTAHRRPCRCRLGHLPQATQGDQDRIVKRRTVLAVQVRTPGVRCEVGHHGPDLTPSRTSAQIYGGPLLGWPLMEIIQPRFEDTQYRFALAHGPTLET